MLWVKSSKEKIRAWIIFFFPVDRRVMKVLLAEDDPVSLKLLETTLKNFGYEVTCAVNGADAWAKFQDSPTPIVVSDWLMPEMDGLDFCAKVRQMSHIEHRYAYFIMLTAKTGKENHHQAMQVGVDDFLTKPLDQDELFTRLRVAKRILSFTTEIHQLKTLIPICMYCKKVRNDGDYWEQIETYLHAHAGTDFSHGICPECLSKIKTSEGVSPKGKTI